MAEEREPCRHCEGRGWIPRQRCVALVNGRPCRHMARHDPEFYDASPQWAWVKPYCTYHGNLMIRRRARQGAAS